MIPGEAMRGGPRRPAEGRREPDQWPKSLRTVVVLASFVVEGEGLAEHVGNVVGAIAAII